MALVSQGTPNGGGSGGNSKPVPVVIFKLPRTGSSWFTQELNNMATVFISKEILQRGDHGRYSAAEIEAQLIQALTAPTGKMSSKNRWSPDGRFVEDYLAHKTLKPFRTLDVVGFSVNPEHCRGALPPRQRRYTILLIITHYCFLLRPRPLQRSSGPTCSRPCQT